MIKKGFPDVKIAQLVCENNSIWATKSARQKRFPKLHQQFLRLSTGETVTTTEPVVQHHMGQGPVSSAIAHQYRQAANSTKQWVDPLCKPDCTVAYLGLLYHPGGSHVYEALSCAQVTLNSLIHPSNHSPIWHTIGKELASSLKHLCCIFSFQYDQADQSSTERQEKWQMGKLLSLYIHLKQSQKIKQACATHT